MPDPSLRPRAFVLAVRDLHAETAYYRDVLGFAIDWQDGDNWHALMRDEARVMLGRCPDSLPASELGDHSYFAFLATDDVDRLYAEFSARGALIIKRPKTKPWGWREMPVATPGGHRMMFAQWMGTDIAD